MISLLVVLGAFAFCYTLIAIDGLAEQVETECQRCGRQLDPQGFCPKCDQ